MTMVRPPQTAGPAADLVAALRDIARRAGAVVLAHYRDDTPARRKPDASPVTAADEAAERLIVAELASLLPGIPIVAEEAAAAGRIPMLDRHGGSTRRFWLVDPLDGTKEFLSRNGEFTVNIALIEGGRPTLGVVHLPTLGTTYAGAGPGQASLQEPDGRLRAIAARPAPRDGVIALASRSHRDNAALEAFLAGENVAARQIAGSSLKFCRVAEGIADLYPRFGRTMEWDTAAGHAVLAAAGGSVRTLDGAELRYGKPGFENPHFVARGRPAAARQPR